MFPQPRNASRELRLISRLLLRERIRSSSRGYETPTPALHFSPSSAFRLATAYVFSAANTSSKSFLLSLTLSRHTLCVSLPSPSNAYASSVLRDDRGGWMTRQSGDEALKRDALVGFVSLACYHDNTLISRNGFCSWFVAF